MLHLLGQVLKAMIPVADLHPDAKTPLASWPTPGSIRRFVPEGDRVAIRCTRRTRSGRVTRYLEHPAA
jgi:hypothetical protein